MDEKAIIYTKAGLIVRKEQNILLCRAKAFPDLILPGGQIEKGESAEECLFREVSEELGPYAKIDKTSIKFLGTFHDVAAGKPGRYVTILLYEANLSGQLTPSDEIADLIWWPIGKDSDALSPIVRRDILPFLRRVD